MAAWLVMAFLSTKRNTRATKMQLVDARFALAIAASPGSAGSSATSSSRGGRRGARRGSGDEARIRPQSEGFRRGAHREQDDEVAGGNGAATVANLAEGVL